MSAFGGKADIPYCTARANERTCLHKKYTRSRRRVTKSTRPPLLLLGPCAQVGGFTMAPHTKRASKRRRPRIALPVLGAAGVSLAVGSGASANVPTTNVRSQVAQPFPAITLGEEEISDVSLATFYVFDKENAGTTQFGQGVQLAAGCRGCGCRGCGGCAARGCRGCGCGGCRGCVARGCGGWWWGGCAGCGGGCGSCWQWVPGWGWRVVC
jgi:hypothetical protein